MPFPAQSRSCALKRVLAAASLALFSSIGYAQAAESTTAEVQTIARLYSASLDRPPRFGELNDRQYIEQLFRNVLGRDGAQGGIAFWINNLESGSTRAWLVPSAQ